MQYRLLRNNKESGPFTTLQLKEMGLKPYDLLWTEGRGAAWQYASEITELKDFAPTVEEQPFDRFYKRKEELQTVKQPAVIAKKTKPRYRISNGQLIMVEPGNMEVSNSGVITEKMPVRVAAKPAVEEPVAATPDWQDMYTQWQPAPPQKKAVKTEEPVEIETKYSESLDDLKKRYAEKVLGEKKETSSSFSSTSSASVKQNIMAAVALIVLVVGGYIGYTLKKKDAAVTDGKPMVERADISGDNTLQNPPADNNGTVNNEMQPVQNNAQSKVAAGKSLQTAGVITPVAGKLSAAVTTKENNGKALPVNTPQKKVAIVSGNTNTATTAKADNMPATDNKEIAKTSSNSVSGKPVASQSTGIAKANTTAATAPVSAPPVKVPANKQIGDYVSVKKVGGSGNAVQNVKLVVSNVSDFPIDLAVVDIQYFDSKGKYQKGETMYVKDINGGNNVEIRVPDSEKASSIKYKVSMVQSDQKTLYLVAD